MKKTLDYFMIEGAVGGNQEWFKNVVMYIGGCAAATACDCCIYLALRRGMRHLYPYDAAHLTREDYVAFSMKMKPYLKPRKNGVDALDIYIEGFGKYLADQGCDSVRMTPLSGTEKASKAKESLMGQIDKGFPLPCLVLKHKNPMFKDYVWHWFLLTGYDTAGDSCMTKAVTYGEWQWLDMDELWDTGFEKKGGLILYDMR